MTDLPDDARATLVRILAEWRTGCSVGPAGHCAQCSTGALHAIEAQLGLIEDVYAAYQAHPRRKMMDDLHRALGNPITGHG